MQCNLKRVVFLSLFLVAAACGGKSDPAPVAAPANAPANAPTKAPANALSGALAADKQKGEALAKEAIDAFDQMVAEVAKALEAKPAEADAMPKLQAIRAAWTPKMEAFAARRKELTDPVAKGGFFGYMGENRGKAVFRKDNTLGAAYKHYRLDTSAPQVIEFLEKLPDLIEIAHNK